MLYENGVFQCCDQPPTLRVQVRWIYNMEINYVRYECRKCKKFGALGLTEEEAKIYWPYKQRDV